MLGLGITKIKLAVYVAVIACALGIFWYQSHMLDKAQESVRILSGNVATLETSVNIQKETIGVLQEDMKHNAEQSKALAKEFANLNVRHSEKVAKLNSYRGRLENVIIKKPGLAGKLIGNATADIVQLFTEATTDPSDTRQD